MANLNKVLLIGRLTRDPELRYIQSGSAVAEFGLAVNREWNTPQGEKREQTCFVDVVVYGRGAEILHQYMKKGRQIFIEGRLDFSEWKDKDGNRKTKLRVVSENFQFLDGGRGRDAGGEAVPAGSGEGARESFPPGRGPGAGGGSGSESGSGSQRGESPPYRGGGGGGGDSRPGDDLEFPPPSSDLPF